MVNNTQHWARAEKPELRRGPPAATGQTTVRHIPRRASVALCLCESPQTQPSHFTAAFTEARCTLRTPSSTSTSTSRSRSRGRKNRSSHPEKPGRESRTQPSPLDSCPFVSIRGSVKPPSGRESRFEICIPPKTGLYFAHSARNCGRLAQLVRALP